MAKGLLSWHQGNGMNHRSTVFFPPKVSRIGEVWVLLFLEDVNSLSHQSGSSPCHTVRLGFFPHWGNLHTHTYIHTNQTNKKKLTSHSLLRLNWSNRNSTPKSYCSWCLEPPKDESYGRQANPSASLYQWLKSRLPKIPKELPCLPSGPPDLFPKLGILLCLLKSGSFHILPWEFKYRAYGYKRAAFYHEIFQDKYLTEPSKNFAIYFCGGKQGSTEPWRCFYSRLRPFPILTLELYSQPSSKFPSITQDIIPKQYTSRPAYSHLGINTEKNMTSNHMPVGEEKAPSITSDLPIMGTPSQISSEHSPRLSLNPFIHKAIPVLQSQISVRSMESVKNCDLSWSFKRQLTLRRIEILCWWTGSSQPALTDFLLNAGSPLYLGSSLLSEKEAPSPWTPDMKPWKQTMSLTSLKPPGSTTWISKINTVPYFRVERENPTTPFGFSPSSLKILL